MPLSLVSCIDDFGMSVALDHQAALVLWRAGSTVRHRRIAGELSSCEVVLLHLQRVQVWFYASLAWVESGLHA